MAKPQPFERTSSRMSTHKIITSNFIGGIFWALGVTIGFSLLIAFFSLFSHYISFVPFVGKFVSDVIDFVLSYNQHVPH